MLSKEKEAFLTFMMQADVLRFGDFVTKSGRNTPYFINTGNYRSGAQIAGLGKFYAGMVQQSGCRFDALFGPAYKGIPLVTACAGALYTQFGVDAPYFFNRKEAKDHGEGGSLVGYQPKDGDTVAIIEDVVTAGTAVRESMALLSAVGDIRCRDMFISVDRCEVGQVPGKTAIMELQEQFGIAVHALVTVRDVRAFLAAHGGFEALLPKMDAYMAKYCLPGTGVPAC